MTLLFVESVIEQDNLLKKDALKIEDRFKVEGPEYITKNWPLWPDAPIRGDQL